MKNYILKLLTALVLAGGVNAYAGEAESVKQLPNMLVYIQPVEYTNPIQLWHPYHGYWYYQGPIVEAQAMAKLSEVYGDVSLCESNQSGRTLVWLQPKMFYNPQVQLFYGKVTANVYSGMGKSVATYEGESKLHGFLSMKAENWIAKAYTLAINDMVAKMRADASLQALVSSSIPLSASDATPCSMVTLLPTPKIRAMSF